MANVLSAADVAWFADSGIDPNDPLWAGFTPSADPRYIAFNKLQDQIDRVLNATTTAEWLAAMRARSADVWPTNAGEQQLVDAVAANPDGYEIRGGYPYPKPNWVMRNLWWIGPSALVGGSVLAALVTGGAAPAVATAGVLPNTGGALIPALTTAVPASIVAQGVSAGVPYVVGGAVTSLLPSGAAGLVRAISTAAPAIVRTVRGDGNGSTSTTTPDVVTAGPSSGASSSTLMAIALVAGVWLFSSKN